MSSISVIDIEFAKCENLSQRAGGMRIIAKSRLFELARVHSDCLSDVEYWYRLTSKASWRDLSDVRQTFRHADVVGDKTVFNIKGNDYRLIVHIRYRGGVVYIKDLLTHAEYDKDAWKK